MRRYIGIFLSISTTKTEINQKRVIELYRKSQLLLLKKHTHMLKVITRNIKTYKPFNKETD